MSDTVRVTLDVDRNWITQFGNSRTRTRTPPIE